MNHQFALLSTVVFSQSAAPDPSGFVLWARGILPPASIVRTSFENHTLSGNSTFDTWNINGKSRPDVPPLEVTSGKRYPLVFKNVIGDQHPMHLYGHTFEVTSIGEQKISGLLKDGVNVMPIQTAADDVTAETRATPCYIAICNSTWTTDSCSRSSTASS